MKMKQLTVITGNLKKLNEIAAILGASDADLVVRF